MDDFGDVSERAKTETMVDAVGQGGRVRMTGHIRNAAYLFKAFSLVVLSSRTEGIPIVLFEALTAAIPTVVGGVPHVVTRRKSRLVPSEDSGASAAAIRKTAAHAVDTFERVRRASVRLEDEFGAGQWLRRHEGVYRAIAGV